ncbi:cysteine proteinase [Nemania abortiva]|nr:cysteine proteinase [Nemania abortiva]
MVALLPSPDAEVTSCLKDQATRAFSTTGGSHAYTSPLFLRRFLESQLPELSYGVGPGCSSHTMLLIPDQTSENTDESFLSILCADCRYHFHVKTYNARSRPLESTKHPSHMLIPLTADPQDHAHGVGDAGFICAVEDCFYMVNISVVPPKLTTEQIGMLRDDKRILRNLQLARTEDPSRYADIPDTWSAGSAIPTLVRYIEDRLAKPSGEVLKIKKRNKRFRVTFGKDFDDLLPSLGFKEEIDEDGEECWYITEPEPSSAKLPTPVNTQRAHLQDTLEELKTLSSNSSTTPAWKNLMAAFPGYTPRNEADLVSIEISTEDIALLGCLRESPPPWFSWAAIVLAGLCPQRRDIFLDAGLRCIQQRSEEASLNIIMYKSKFDQMPAVDPKLQEAFDFFGVSAENAAKDPHHLLEKYRTLLDSDRGETAKSEGTEHFQTITNYIGTATPGDHSAIHPHPTGLKKRRMSIGSASRLLNVDASFTAEMIRDFANNLIESVGRPQIVEALEVLSDLKHQQDKYDEARSLKETADFLEATESVAASQPDNSSRPEQSLITSPTTPLTTPPGLKNIGNTCYLNSLLQYFYNVQPIREMVLNYDQFELGFDVWSINNRRTGGNGTRVTLEEAIIARQFIGELRALFSELQTTTGAAASPSQKLANTALSSAKEILTSKYQIQPPPLPARPSPVPPISTGKEDATVNVKVEPISELHHVASFESGRTLVNDTDNREIEVYIKPEKDIEASSTSATHIRGVSPEDRALSDTVEHVEDITMEETPPPLSLEQKVTEISERLTQSDRSGTSQQDVEEIIGNILEHLMRAIRPTGTMAGKPDLQADKITELFFTTIVNSTIKTAVNNPIPSSTSSIDEDILNEEVVPERWITAFPHPDKELKVKNNLYEALDRYFSYELLANGSLARYTTIRELPPIVHICIQRTDASGVKNRNPVIMPEELYLDRYMEAAAGSDLWSTRRRVWAIKERIKELEFRTSGRVESVLRAPGPPAWGDYVVTQTQGEYEDPIDLNKELWADIPLRSKRTPLAAQLSQQMETTLFKRRSMSNSAETGSSDFVDILWKDGRRLDDIDTNELEDLRREEAGAFNSMKRHKYCLHAMICHGGGMNAGHYWVWVRDFKNQVWYKYNDSRVTKDSRDSQQVISEVNDSGDPYYVAYVQDELKDILVDVPQRTQRREDDLSMVDAGEEELEVIDSIPIDTPPQPANSPVNTPVPEATMGDASPLELEA